MVAPRGLFIMDNPHIGELSPKYGHVAALAGAEVYKALGAGDAISYCLERRERHALLGAAGVADAVQERRRAVPQEDRYGGGRHQRELGPVGQPGRLARLDDADAAVVAVLCGTNLRRPD